jgi:hypothetical protein
VSVCIVFEFGWCGFGCPRGGTLLALCLGLVRISVGRGSLAEAINRRLKK